MTVAMNQRVKNLEIKVLDRVVTIPSGTPASHLLSARRDSAGYPCLAAIMNNRLVDFDTKLVSSGELKPVTVASKEGAAVYRRSLTLILYEAAKRLFPDMQLVVGQSLGYGYHFTCRDAKGQEGIDNGKLMALEKCMLQLVREDKPFKHETMSVEEAMELFTEQGLLDKVALLKTWRSDDVTLVTLGTYYDIQHGPVAPSTGAMLDFGLSHYPPGFVLQFPSLLNGGEHPANYDNQRPLFHTYQETMRWNEILGVRTVGQLNELCLSGEISDIIRISEGFHEKKIAQIADMIAEKKSVRLVLIAGPSSSGKTTFAKRLSLQLKVNGIRPVAISMDNYYVNRVDTPCHPDGSYDFEALEAIDLDLFNHNLTDLLAGKTVDTPIYDFHTGERVPKEKWVPMAIGPRDVIIVEGIHGLNPRFTSSVPDEQKFRIYINALTQLCIDNSNRIFTSETRLIRRIVRDRRYRGYPATRTIELWPSVRLGERRHIFPFQEEADAIFNSALVYEPAVLKVYAERYLLEVPRNHPSAVTAQSLLSFLDLFVPVFPDAIPPTSLLREFIGGSAFSYK